MIHPSLRIYSNVLKVCCGISDVFCVSLRASQLTDSTHLAVIVAMPPASPPYLVSHSPGTVGAQSHGLQGLTFLMLVSQDYLPWKHLEISPDPIPSRENIFHFQSTKFPRGANPRFPYCFILLAPGSSWVPGVIVELPSWLSLLDFFMAA